MPLPTPSSTTTAVVTGASSGIGADIARELVSRGHGVTLVARREDKLRALAAELGDTVRVEVIACDVADPDARATLFDEVAARGLTVDVLVNNAGIGTIGPVAKTTVAAEIAQVRVNVEAVIDLTTRAVQQMVPRGRGAILNVGSTAGFHPFPGQAGYAATKAFVRAYTEGLRAELAGSGVTVATLQPRPGAHRVPAVGRHGREDLRRRVPEVHVDAVARRREGRHRRARARSRRRDRRVCRVELSTRLFQLIPRRLLMPLLAKQHPALRTGR